MGQEAGVYQYIPDTGLCVADLLLGFTCNDLEQVICMNGPMAFQTRKLTVQLSPPITRWMENGEDDSPVTDGLL